MADEQHPSTAQDSQGRWDEVQPVYIVGMSSDVNLGGTGGGGGGGSPARVARVGYERSDPVTVAVIEPSVVITDIGELTDGSKVVMPDGVAWARCALSASVFMAENDDALPHPVILRVFEADVPTLDGAHSAIVLNAQVVYLHGSTVYFQGPPFVPTPGMNYYAFFGSVIPLLVSNVAIDTEVLA